MLRAHVDGMGVAALALITCISWAQEHTDDFSFGPQDPLAVYRNGLWVDPCPQGLATALGKLSGLAVD